MPLLDTKHVPIIEYYHNTFDIHCSSSMSSLSKIEVIYAVRPFIAVYQTFLDKQVSKLIGY